jgi:hypothetical protein
MHALSATRLVSRVLATVGILLAVECVAATPLDLTGRYSGTYVVDGTTAAQSLQLEVEKQHGRRLHVSVFAMNEPEYMGRGHISRDDATVKLATHATGHRRLVLAASLLDGGATLDGTFTAKRPGHTATTGTFSVVR